jgi:DNA helicase II / ATP-dependent DNA helicase PcrA
MIDLSGLNDKQRLAAETVDGPLLILAGAGSGKTRTVTFRIGHMLANLKIDPTNILAISFTNKAAKEMKDRVKHLVHYKLRRGLTLSTFHSLGLRILREEIHKLGYDNNFTIYDTNDQLAIIREALKLLKAEKSFDRKTIHSKIGLLKNNGISPEEFVSTEFYDDEAPDDIATDYAYRFYQERLHFYNAVDFDDILFLTVKLFELHPELAVKYSEQFKYIMIDEFQDTNGLQVKMIDFLTSTHNNLCVVGDDDQSIYAFRGADISNILNFSKKYKNTTVIKLEENYRSTSHILDLANSIIKNNTNRTDKTMWSNNHSGEKPLLWVCQDDLHEAAVIVDDIIKYQTKGGHLSNVAVLYRSNRQVPPLEDQLRLSMVPYNIVGGQKLYDKKEIKDLIAYLAVILNRKDEMSLRRIINTPARGIGAKSLKDFIAISRETGKTLFSVVEDIAANEQSKRGEHLKKFVDIIHTFDRKFKEESLQASLDGLIHYIDFFTYIDKCYDSPKMRVHKKTDIQNFVLSAARFSEVYEEEISLKSFVQKLLLADSQDTRNPSKDEDGKTNEVTLMTLHSSKGLEFDEVYLIGMEEEKLPHRRVIRDGEDIGEERRLAYVGVTRAKKRLVMTHTKEKVYNNNPVPRHSSRFLVEIEPEWFTTQDRTTFGHMSKEEEVEFKQDYFNDLLKSLE